MEKIMLKNLSLTKRVIIVLSFAYLAFVAFLISLDIVNSTRNGTGPRAFRKNHSV